MFIKHEKFTDICIEVRHEKQGADGVCTYYGSFWNLGQTGTSFCIDIECKIKVLPEERSHWVKCIDGAKDLRQAKWEPL